MDNTIKKKPGRKPMYTQEELKEHRRIRDRKRYEYNKIHNPEYYKKKLEYRIELEKLRVVKVKIENIKNGILPKGLYHKTKHSEIYQNHLIDL